MSFIDEVRAKRQSLANVLADDEYSGIRKIVEELYPDRAHFIFELLQNAEDAGATQALFHLETDKLSFEHNGRPFSEADILAITNIGKGTKEGREDKIGRFGVGFKAVFAYSETPHIWSPTFSFKISDLVMPAAINPRPELRHKTRFEFPFNNPKKEPQEAYAEVEHGLNDLAETNLLFLSHLMSIRWQIGERDRGEIKRIQHSDNHVEVRKSSHESQIAMSHFLRFSKPVTGLERQRVSVAFELDCLPNVESFDPLSSLSAQFHIVPANPGQVAVFFTADKEMSGLRFHLHAPFVPELSRASIKDTPVNEPLFQQLAQLSAASLHTIRDMKLLTGEFLGVLPNPEDAIPARYHLIRESIIDEFNNEPLMPTYAKSHAQAKRLLQAKASFKQLLSPEDLEVLVDYEDVAWQWAINASQKGNSARFMAGLSITDWNIDEFVSVLAGTNWRNNLPDDQFFAWLGAKPMEWHQELYSLLFTEYEQYTPWQKQELCSRLKSLRLVRLKTGDYNLGNQCFFPSEGAETDELLPRVDALVYTSEGNTTQQEKSKRFLETVGVRQVGDAEQVESILKSRYTAERCMPSINDLNRFIELVEKEPARASLFAGYHIFERKDGKWGQPSQVFLDIPYRDTGLRFFYDALGVAASRVELSENYFNCGIDAERIATFAASVGVQTELQIEGARCKDNPLSRYLLNEKPNWTWNMYSGIDDDFAIPQLDKALQSVTVGLSQIVWNTLRKNDTGLFCVARFRKYKENIRQAPSQLASVLTKSKWVPQTDGRFVTPAEASRDLLPAGFPFDSGSNWLEAIHFGKETKLAVEAQRKKLETAAQLGFSNEESLNRAKRFIELCTPEQQERILAELERSTSNLPEHEPSNPRLRAERVVNAAESAPVRTYEDRTRSAAVSRESVKEMAKQYLLEQYTNGDCDMICQICKGPVPFKLDDGVGYFEAVEFLPHLSRHHSQNYLALCPNHAAMFMHANGSRADLQLKIDDPVGNQIVVVLAQREMQIYFTKTHLFDLKCITQVE